MPIAIHPDTLQSLEGLIFMYTRLPCTHKYILQFDVPVNYLVCMEMHQSHAELLHGQSGISLRKMLTM